MSSDGVGSDGISHQLGRGEVVRLERLIDEEVERSDTTRIQSFDSGVRGRGVNTTPRQNDNATQTFTRGRS